MLASTVNLQLSPRSHEHLPEHVESESPSAPVYAYGEDTNSQRMAILRNLLTGTPAIFSHAFPRAATNYCKNASSSSVHCTCSRGVYGSTQVLVNSVRCVQISLAILSIEDHIHRPSKMDPHAANPQCKCTL